MLKHCFCCLCSAILAARYVGLLIPWPRMEHIPTAFGRHSLNYWMARGALKLHISEIGITVCILKMRRPRSRFLHNFCKFLQRLSATTKFPHRFPDFMLRAFFFFFFFSLHKNFPFRVCHQLLTPRDGRAWWAAVYGVAQIQTWLKWLSSSSSTPL